MPTNPERENRRADDFAEPDWDALNRAAREQDPLYQANLRRIDRLTGGASLSEDEEWVLQQVVGRRLILGIDAERRPAEGGANREWDDPEARFIAEGRQAAETFRRFVCTDDLLTDHLELALTFALESGEFYTPEMRRIWTERINLGLHHLIERGILKLVPGQKYEGPRPTWARYYFPAEFPELDQYEQR